jgi:5-methylcytosine-specific restriction enzyme subunit McrC
MMAGAVRFVLAENDRTGVVAELDPVQVACLRGTGLVKARPQGPGTVRLLPARRVGAVHIGDVDVVVTPKVSIARLLFMLGYAANPGFRPENVDGIEDEDLWPAVAETLCRHTERALAGGVLLGYVTEEAASTVLRGRVRVGDQIARRHGIPLPLEITYDEYSVDTPENQLLRAALRRMLAVPRVSAGLRARLRHLDGRLDGVSSLIPNASLPQWRSDRLNARYHSALRLAKLVLNTSSFEVGLGGLPVAAFVVDMAVVFENFVTVALREAWASRPGATIGQYATTLDTDSVVTMNVDVVHAVDGVPQIIVDAKYKLEDKRGRYPNHDHYQMLAYCTALNVDAAWLVYASGTSANTPRRIRNSSITITEYPLDLDVRPQQLLGQIDHLATTAWSSLGLARGR